MLRGETTGPPVEGDSVGGWLCHFPAFPTVHLLTLQCKNHIWVTRLKCKHYNRTHTGISHNWDTGNTVYAGVSSTWVMTAVTHRFTKGKPIMKNNSCNVTDGEHTHTVLLLVWNFEVNECLSLNLVHTFLLQKDSHWHSLSSVLSNKL